MPPPKCDRLIKWGMLAFLLSTAGCASIDVPSMTPELNPPVYFGAGSSESLEEESKEQDNPNAAVRMSSHQSEPQADPSVVQFAQDKRDELAPGDKGDIKPPQLKSPEPVAGPKAPTVKAITLDRAINTTLIADPRLRVGFESINQANANLLTASLRPNPYLFTDAQLLPLTRPFVVDQTGGPPQADALLSYPIDWFLFGKRAANMAAANMGVRVSQAAYNDLIRRRVTETAVFFYDVLEAKALMGLAGKDVAYFEQVEAITKKAVLAGGRSDVDLKRVELDLLNSKRALRDTELLLVTAQARLRAVMGLENSDASFDVDGNLQAKLSAEPISATEAYQVAVDNRPDLESDRLRIAEAIAQVTAENRKAYPDVTPHIGVTRQFQGKAMGMPDANSYEIALTTTLPFSNRNQGNRSRAMSVLAQRRYELQASLVNLRAEIEQAAQAFRTAYQNATSVAEEQLKLATEVRDSLNKSYAAGGSPLIDVLDAERNYRDTYRTYITGRANYWRALHKLNSAIGKQVVK